MFSRGEGRIRSRRRKKGKGNPSSLTEEGEGGVAMGFTSAPILKSSVSWKKKGGERDSTIRRREKKRRKNKKVGATGESAGFIFFLKR